MKPQAKSYSDMTSTTSLVQCWLLLLLLLLLLPLLLLHPCVVRLFLLEKGLQRWFSFVKRAENGFKVAKRVS